MQVLTKHEAVEQLVRSVYGLGIVQREISRHALAELGTQGFTALAVAHRFGPVRISDVAERLRIDMSVASRQVRALMEAGYVERQPDDEDRRAHRISITERGSEVLRESHRRMVAAFEGALDDWDERDITALADGMTRLREAIA
jgi:DNA-binding MarR family transcriptional regulator